jgi:anti-sigma factor RsiW
MRLTPELEDTLRRFVRGEVDEALRLELEELLLTDPEAFEALGVVEDELMEEYLDGGGSALEREAFEEHLASSPEPRRRLRFVRALKARATAEVAPLEVDARREPVDRRPAERRPSWREALAGILRPWQWQPAWAAVGIVLALSLAGNVWQASRRAGPLETAPTVELAGGLLRAEGTLPRVSVPAGATGVRLLLELPGDDYPRYRAALLDDDGNELWVAPRLLAETTSGRTSVALVVPAALLPRGDYRLTISGVRPSGEQEPLSSSPFRVTAP